MRLEAGACGFRLEHFERGPLNARDGSNCAGTTPGSDRRCGLGHRATDRQLLGPCRGPFDRLLPVRLAQRQICRRPHNGGVHSCADAAWDPRGEHRARRVAASSSRGSCRARRASRGGGACSARRAQVRRDRLLVREAQGVRRQTALGEDVDVGSRARAGATARTLLGNARLWLPTCRRDRYLSGRWRG